MKEIKAIIRPFKLMDVVTELQKIENLPGVTISDIGGFGKSKAKDAKANRQDFDSLARTEWRFSLVLF